MNRAPSPAELKRYKADRQAQFDQRTKELKFQLQVMAPTLIAQLNQFQALVFEQMERQGFWEGSADSTPSKIALMHSELSEMLEADRNGVEADDKVPDFDGPTAEAADVFVRLADWCGRHEKPFGEALIAKMMVNLDRPYKHGKAY